MAQIANTVMTIPAFISNDAADDSITITDPISGVKNIVLTTGYYEFQLNDATGDGTEATPFHLLKKLAAGSTTKWHYSIETDGRVTISYSGTGTATFVFNSTHIKQLFGSTSATLTFSGASSQTMTYAPYGMFVSKSRKGDTSWRHTPGHSVYQVTPASRVIGWNDGNHKQTRSFTFDFLPRDQSFKTTGMVSTPAYPVSSSEWNTTPTALSYTAPYTALRFAKESPGRIIKLYLGSLPYNGTDEYYKVYSTPNSIKKEKRFPPSITGNEQYLSFDEFEVIQNDSDSGEASYATGSLAAITTPSDIFGLYAWYKSTALTSSSGTVSQVSDKSGNGRHAVQATSGSQPLYSATGGANNKPYWTNAAGASGGRYLLAGVAADWTFLHNGAGHTIFIVQKNTATDAYYILGTQNGSGANRGLGLARLSNTQTRYAIGDGSSQIFGIDFTMPNNSWSKLCVYGDTGTNPDYYARVNGTATLDGNESGTPSATVSPYPLGIGVGGGGGYSTDASFHEIIIYNRKLTDMEITQIEAYLNDEYGL